MSISTCPVATVDAPVERVWDLVANPSRYDLWWEARTVSIVPEGPAQSGQQVIAHAGAFGLHAVIRLTVAGVDRENYQVDVLTRMPFGISIDNHIRCTPLGGRQTRVSFG